ncbi:MAG: hypothetical protein EXR54_07545 [Dehalococcoidia bacterium]|nr:hypothetical protein [Dehalococcoidia bacterium]MSQ17402.1 hypothetical protein [Dehalococcoidia bacterium]
MPADPQLTWEDFLRLAQQAGLDASSPHLAELFPYVQGVLASLEPLRSLDVSGEEPDMAFLPNPE